VISEMYAVQFLLQGTVSLPARIQWKERASTGAGYTTEVGDVRLTIESVQARPVALLALRFDYAEDECAIYEPASTGWFTQKYASEEDRSLAEALRNLMQAVVKQCSQRSMHNMSHPEETRERIFRHMLFERPAEAEAEARR